ncbi:MAG: molybdopterin-guanine dinucleotide biosynthesis protein B [Candidatus Thorarchaeota archaeon]
MKFKIISVIGYSGSGKTNFITTAIKFLKENLNFNVAVIKNVKHHQIDEKGKDSHKFTEAGARYSVIRNDKNEIAIFLKNEEIRLEELFKWLDNGPFKIDIIITEGFRNLNQPTVLCTSDLKEIQEQLSKDVKIVSGVICSKDISNKKILDLPIIDIKSQFSRFLDIFEIK